MALNIIQLVVVCLLIPNITNAGAACKPKLERRSTHPLTTGQNVKLLCGVTECMPVSKVIYEKTDVVSPVKWTSVYEGVDSTNHHSLDTGTNYDVTGRVMFTALTSTFILEILSVTVKDNFKWRCIVIDHNNVQHVSNSVQLAVVPEENVTIKPTRPKLVAGQGRVFTCEIDNIYPQPKIAWTVDGNHHSKETTSITPYGDGLMLVRSRIYIQFSKPGQAVLVCTLHTNTGETWMEHKITIDVKSPAKITDPEAKMNINATVGSAIVINCTASGYRPTITWQRNGFDIRNDDPQYIIKDKHNITLSTSTLTLSPISIPLTCEKIEEYNSVYTCTAKLKEPYTSLQKSKAINVKVIHPPQIRRIPQTVIADAISTVTLRCEVCSNFDSISKWTYGGQPLNGDNIKFLPDGALQISGNPRSGGYYKTVINSMGSVDCVVYLVNTSQVKEDSRFPKIVLLGLCIFIIVAIIRRPAQIGRVLSSGKVKAIAHKLFGRFLSSREQKTSSDGSGIIYEKIQPLLNDSSDSSISLNSVMLVKTFPIDGSMRCIWSAKRTECVLVGGWDSSSITVIDTSYKPIKHTLTTGDNIKYGLAIDDSYHLVNTYHIKTKHHSIKFVKIDTNCTTRQIIVPRYTLDLRCAATPRCLFNMDNNHVGVYGVDAPVYSVNTPTYNVNAPSSVVISFQVSDILTQVNPLPVNRIALEHHHASLSDKLCINENGEICLVSYFDCEIYIYKQNGELHKTISRPGFDKASFPCHVLGLSDKSLVFVTNDRIHLYDGESKWEGIQLNTSVSVVMAVFTNKQLWCCDSDNKINVYIIPVIGNSLL